MSHIENHRYTYVHQWQHFSWFAATLLAVHKQPTDILSLHHKYMMCQNTIALIMFKEAESSCLWHLQSRL